MATTTVIISSFRGDIQSQEGTVGAKHGAFHIIACIGMNSLTIPDSRGIFMGLASNATGGLEICACTNQYIDITIMTHSFL